eukprot:1157424-Pelagomonas_calceolata.AAC.7
MSNEAVGLDLGGPVSRTASSKHRRAASCDVMGVWLVGWPPGSISVYTRALVLVVGWPPGSISVYTHALVLVVRRPPGSISVYTHALVLVVRRPPGSISVYTRALTGAQISSAAL